MPNTTKAAIYYTDNRLDEKIMEAVQWQLYHCRYTDTGQRYHRVVAVSLKELPWYPGGTWLAGDENIVVELERGPLTMFKQILVGLEGSDEDVCFFAEHDVLYHPSHFDFAPPDPTKVYYNQNLWQVRTSDGHCVYWDAKRVSQLCAYRELLIEHYRKRIELVERNSFSMKMGYEPASHNRKERVDDLKSEYWRSEFPNLDLKHGANLSPSKWSPADFRSQKNCQNWQESDGEIQGWGQISGRFPEFLDGL
jgi:hypothetical protein